MRSILRKAVREWQRLDRAPAVRMLKEPTRRVRYLTHDEADRLLAELPPHLRDMAAFSLASGLRAANVTGLRWSAVDIDRWAVGPVIRWCNATRTWRPTIWRLGQIGSRPRRKGAAQMRHKGRPSNGLQAAESLQPVDPKEKSGGPCRIRTYDQRIKSPPPVGTSESHAGS